MSTDDRFEPELVSFRLDALKEDIEDIQEKLASDDHHVMMAYLDFMQQTIFEPLGMSRTGPDITRQDRVMGYAGFFSDTKLLIEPHV